MSVHPEKTQIILGIRPVWSVFAVRSCVRTAKALAIRAGSPEPSLVAYWLSWSSWKLMESRQDFGHFRVDDGMSLKEWSHDSSVKIYFIFYFFLDQKKASVNEHFHELKFNAFSTSFRVETFETNQRERIPVIR